MFRGKRTGLLVGMAGFLLLAVLIACGGGGSESTSHQDSGDTGNVALFLADGPADEFDHIWIEVSQISLLGGDGSPVVIYETEDPTRIDLLTLQEDDLLLSVNASAPAGTYPKIRLIVESVAGEQTGQLVDFHLESKKIDLNPRGPMDITPGETLALRLDIDAEKSIHVAGPNYNFRPVVFVEAGSMKGPLACGQLIKGEITELLLAESDEETVIGFRMKPFRGMAELDIHFQEDVTVFGEDGRPTGPEILAVGQTVCISGELATDGRFLAEMVIIGEVDTLTGVVESAVADQQFTLTPGLHWDDPWFEGKTVPEENSMTVALSDGTLIMLGDTEAGPDQIQVGRKARVVGKRAGESNTMNAISVYLTDRKIVGKLTNVAAAEGGSLLTIETSTGFPLVDPPKKNHPEDLPIQKACYGGEEITIFLPDSAPINIKGGIDLSLDKLKALVACEALRVQVLLDTAVELDGAVQGSALMVWPQMVKMTVEQIDQESRIITAGGGKMLYVAEETPVWLQDAKEQTAIEFQDIEIGDVLLVTALKVCEPTDYEAVVIVKVPGCEPPDEPVDPCGPQLDHVTMVAAEAADNTIIGEDETSVAVSEQTIYVDLTQTQLQEMAFSDIVPGDTLVCHFLRTCDDELNQALVVIRIDPDSEPPQPDPGSCLPELTKMEAVVETVSEGAIMTTEGQTIQVPEGTPILVPGKENVDALSLGDIVPDDSLEFLAVHTCAEEPGLTALMIIKRVEID